VTRYREQKSHNQGVLRGVFVTVVIVVTVLVVVVRVVVMLLASSATVTDSTGVESVTACCWRINCGSGLVTSGSSLSTSLQDCQGKFGAVVSRCIYRKINKLKCRINSVQLHSLLYKPFHSPNLPKKLHIAHWATKAYRPLSIILYDLW
jgi:hypothetical protein